MGPCVTNCAIFNRRSLWGYRGDDTVPFIKVTVSDPKNLSKVKDESFFTFPTVYLTDNDFLASLRAFERGQIDFHGLFPPEILTYESNIAYTMRFMIDTKVSILINQGLN